ncbi:MAG TPA: DUF3016 domain-containing protein [Opitutaceae bacterium]
MKAISLISTLAFCLAITPLPGAQSQSDDVTIDFLEPDKYTDFKTSPMGGKKDQDALAREFRAEIMQVVNRYLPPGYRLLLRFRDIDMAGEFEPQLGPNYDSVRIVKAIYIPSIVVEFEIRNEAGDVVSRGQRRVTDHAFQDTVTFRRDRTLFYETELVADLLREITRSL